MKTRRKVYRAKITTKARMEADVVSADQSWANWHERIEISKPAEPMHQRAPPRSIGPGKLLGEYSFWIFLVVVLRA